MRSNIPIGSELHGDNGYTSYLLEDGLRDWDKIHLIVARKSNSKRPHTEKTTVHTSEDTKMDRNHFHSDRQLLWSKHPRSDSSWIRTENLHEHFSLCKTEL